MKRAVRLKERVLEPDVIISLSALTSVASGEGRRDDPRDEGGWDDAEQRELL